MEAGRPPHELQRDDGAGVGEIPAPHPTNEPESHGVQGGSRWQANVLPQHAPHERIDILKVWVAKVLEEDGDGGEHRTSL